MKNLYCLLILLFVGMFAFTYVEGCEEKEQCSIHETTFFMSSHDLYFENEDILLQVGENFYPIVALEKCGRGWKARIASAGYCQMGHNLCKGCSLCHKEGCIYYIRPCRLWN